MDYRIISADPNKGQITVTFANNSTDLATYVIDVPIKDGKYITGTELNDEIMLRAPMWLLTRSEEVKSASGFDNIVSLVITPQVANTTITVNNVDAAATQAAKIAEIKAVVQQVLSETQTTTI